MRARRDRVRRDHSRADRRGRAWDQARKGAAREAGDKAPEHQANDDPRVEDHGEKEALREVKERLRTVEGQAAEEGPQANSSKSPMKLPTAR